MTDDSEPMFSERLCMIIKQYWRIRGRKVNAWVEYQRFSAANNPDTRSLFVIRSEGIPIQ